MLDGRSCGKFRQAHGRRKHLLSQFQTEIPYPLAHNLPPFLAAWGMRAPTVRVLLLVLIGEDGLKGAAMQIQVKHILGGERLGRHRGVENLVDPRVAQRVAPFYELAPENASWGHLTGGKRTRWLLPVRVACREHGCCDRCKEQHLALRRRRHAQHERTSQP